MPDLPALGPITLTEANGDFVNGYQVGLLRYHMENADRPLTDSELYEVLARIVFDTHNTDRYRAGKAAGWFAGLFAHCQQRGCKLPTLAVAPTDLTEPPMLHTVPPTECKAHSMAPLMSE